MSIDDALAVYFYRYGQLPLPDVGHFFLSYGMANLSYPDRKVYEPEKTISFSSAIVSEAHLVSWLSEECEISYQEAADSLKQWVSRINQDLASGLTLRWHGIGQIKSTKEGGGITIYPDDVPTHNTYGVEAEKVIRTGHVHMVRVGEEEKSSREMEETLNQRKHLARKIWPFIALSLLLAGFASIWLISGRLTQAWNRKGNYKPVQIEDMPIRNQWIP